MSDAGRKLNPEQANRLVNAAGGAPKTPKTFDGWMKEMEGSLKEALPSQLPVERFMRMIITNYKATPGLQQCTMPSVLGAALQAAQLGLMIGTLDQAYLIPYSNYKGKDDRGQAIFAKEAQLQIGYKGYIELGYRTGKVAKIDSEKVYASDDFDFEYGSNEFIRHKPRGLESDNDLPTHYYCIVHLKDGTKKFLVRTYQQIIRHAKKHTDMYKIENGASVLNMKSNWNKNFDSMALKTVIRELYKTMELTTEFHYAMNADESIKSVDHANLSRNMAEEVINLRSDQFSVTEEPDMPPPQAEPQPEPVGNHF